VRRTHGSIVTSPDSCVGRTGRVAVRLFCRLNDRDLHAPTDDAFDLVVSVADGSLRDVADIAARLRRWVVDQRV